MKTFKLQSYECREVDKVYCDICKKQIKEGGFKIEEASLTCRIGFAYPEGGSVVTYSADFCACCFENKVVPLLNSIEGFSLPSKEENF